MTGDHWASLTYLVILGLLLGAWSFRYIIAKPGQAAQSLLAWGLIFAAALAATALWQDIKGSVMPQQSMFVEDGRIELPRAADGHYYVTLDVNDTPTRFVVDTGATAMVLTRQAAERAGLDDDGLIFLGTARTANGLVETAPVTLDRVSLGPFVEQNFRAYVNGGEMDTSLLGMDYLSRFDRLEIAGGKLVLER